MDETYDYRLLRVVLETGRRYRSGELDAEGVTRNLSAIWGALEGDVPKEVRDAIIRAEGAIEIARFSTGGRRETLRILGELRDTIARHYPALA
jgi:hypothetical protein